MTASESCLSLSNLQVLEFDWFHNDLTSIMNALPNNGQQVQEIHVSNIFRNVNASSPQMKQRFASVITGCPKIQKIKFEGIDVQDCGIIFSAISKARIPCLEFRSCDISCDYYLQRMLISGSIKELILDNCCIHDNRGVGSTIAAGLKKNQSLRSFTYWDLHGCEALLAAIPIMVARNRNLKTLGVNLSTCQGGFIALLQAIEARQALKSLILRSNRFGMGKSQIQHILQTCAATGSFKELDFSGITFNDKSSLQFLLEQLSERAVINTLALPTQIRFSNGRYCQRCPKIQSLLPTLKVRTLLTCQQLLFSRTFVDEIARVGYIQHLGIQCYDADFFTGELSNWLREFPLPIELFLINGHPTLNTLQSIANYDKSSTGLKCITYQSTSNTVVRIARQLTDMEGLRKLSVLCDNSAIPREFFAVLAQILEQNRFLSSVSVHAQLSQVMTNPAVRKELERIRCSLAINRVGHLRLMVHPNPVPASLWARVLARSSFDPEGIYFILRENPDLVVGVRQRWGLRRILQLLPRSCWPTT